MNFLPDVDENGNLKEGEEHKRLYEPPRYYSKKRAEEQLSDLNNLGRRKVSEDFSDSTIEPHEENTLPEDDHPAGSIELEG